MQCEKGLRLFRERRTGDDGWTTILEGPGFRLRKSFDGPPSPWRGPVEPVEAEGIGFTFRPYKEAVEMTRERFKGLVAEAIDTIPKRFAREVRNVAIVVEDRPSSELLAEMEVEPQDVLLGLYQGVPLTERHWGHGNALPDRITLFQREIEEECDGNENEIVVAIGETLIHELGHYFGMSEEEIMEIEERYWHGNNDSDNSA